MTDDQLVGFNIRDCLAIADRQRLTPRQRDVFLLSLCDKSPKDIARLLGRKTNYVRVVRQAVVRRLGVHDGLNGIRRLVAEIARARLGRNGGGGGG